MICCCHDALNPSSLARQYIPKGSDFDLYSEENIAEIERKLNHRPNITLTSEVVALPSVLNCVYFIGSPIVNPGQDKSQHSMKHYPSPVWTALLCLLCYTRKFCDYYSFCFTFLRSLNVMVLLLSVNELESFCTILTETILSGAIGRFALSAYLNSVHSLPCISMSFL